MATPLGYDGDDSAHGCLGIDLITGEGLDAALRQCVAARRERPHRADERLTSGWRLARDRRNDVEA
jgi:hypothetical protein